MRDRFGRKIDTLRISVTDRCNFGCLYCSGAFNKVRKEEILSFEEIIEIVKIFSNLGIEKIKITGGEPLIRKNITYLIGKISKIKGISDVSLTTNGFYLSEKMDEILNSGIKRINISLDTLKRDRFKIITGIDGLYRVLEGIDISRKYLKIKLNVVLMKNLNLDEIFDFIEFSKERDLILRFIEIMPVYKNLNFWKNNFVSYKEVIERLGNLKEVRFLSEKGNTKYFLFDDFVFGFITSVSEPFCYNCNKLRIDARGNLFLCLYGRPVLNLKMIERKGIEKTLEKIIYLKPKKRENLNLPLMNVVGG